MKWVKKWRVPRSKGDGTWVVSRADDESWGCSCPRWKFHREQCHHILAVQQNPDAYDADHPKELPEIIPGNVEACTVIDGRCLHPLIPIPDNGTLATIVYDLLKMGYSFGRIKTRFEMIPRQWTAKAVLAHVEAYGRVLSPTKLNEPYRTVPA
jgi:hypothetical protein